MRVSEYYGFFEWIGYVVGLGRRLRVGGHHTKCTKEL